MYFTERLEIDGLVLHKTCFRCRECNTKLSAGTYTKINGDVFCKPHYRQLFQLKGNYEEGFAMNKS